MARQLVDALVAQARSDPSLDLSSPAVVAIISADAPTRAQAAALLAAELKGGMMEGFLRRLGKTTAKAPALHRMLACLLEGDLPLTEAQLVALLWAPWEGLPMERLLHHVERYARLHGLPREAAEPLEELGRQVPQASAALRATDRWLRDWPTASSIPTCGGEDWECGWRSSTMPPRPHGWPSSATATGRRRRHGRLQPGLVEPAGW